MPYYTPFLGACKDDSPLLQFKIQFPIMIFLHLYIMVGHTLHQNDREALAKRLSLSLEEFDRLVASGNHAYEVIKDLGPFNGREDLKEPTFRITAEPVTLPKGSKATLTQLGNDLPYVAKALQTLPEKYKKELGEDLDFRIPPTWRIDVIIDTHGQVRLNEIEGQDGANALMMAEQFAYNLQTLKESTAAKLIPTLKAMALPQKNNHYTMALIRVDNAHNPNADRFIKFLDTLSKGSIKMEHINENDIKAGKVLPDWKKYAGIITETSYLPQDLYDLGMQKEQVISTGIYNAMVNKGVFALFFEPDLHNHWIGVLGEERFDRLQKIFIPSRFVRTTADLAHARKEKKVVKVSWAGANGHLVNRSRGVALPVDGIEQGSDERWNLLKEVLQKGAKLIEQDFVIPATMPAFLRKKSTNLEKVTWYNRVCVKYVAEGNPNEEILPSVALTATEVTLGPEVIPAGRMCAFTAGKLV